MNEEMNERYEWPAPVRFHLSTPEESVACDGRQVYWLALLPPAVLPAAELQWILRRSSALTVAGTAPAIPDSLLNRDRYQPIVNTIYSVVIAHLA